MANRALKRAINRATVQKARWHPLPHSEEWPKGLDPPKAPPAVALACLYLPHPTAPLAVASDRLYVPHPTALPAVAFDSRLLPPGASQAPFVARGASAQGVRAQLVCLWAHFRKFALPERFWQDEIGAWAPALPIKAAKRLLCGVVGAARRASVNYFAQMRTIDKPAAVGRYLAWLCLSTQSLTACSTAWLRSRSRSARRTLSSRYSSTGMYAENCRKAGFPRRAAVILPVSADSGLGRCVWLRYRIYSSIPPAI